MSLVNASLRSEAFPRPMRMTNIGTLFFKKKSQEAILYVHESKLQTGGACMDRGIWLFRLQPKISFVVSSP
jgi:hypothetical protein